MGIRIGIGSLRIGQGGGGTEVTPPFDWSSYWTTLISATVETAAPTHVVLTFPAAQSGLFASDFSVSNCRVLAINWTGAVLTITVSRIILVYEDGLIVTFNKTAQTAAITNNITVADRNWFDNDLATITKDGGEAISLWTEKLGTGHDLAQATADNKPLWDTDGVLGDGSNDFMLSPAFVLEDEVMIYIVAKFLDYTQYDYLFDGRTGAAYVWQRYPTNTLRAEAQSASANNTELAINTFGIIRVLYKGATSKFIINDGTPIVWNCGECIPNGFRLFSAWAGGSCGHAKVKEIILGGGADTAHGELDVYNYLAREHSFPINRRAFSYIEDADVDGYWHAVLCQNPNNPNIVKTIFYFGLNLQVRHSTDRGQTWGVAQQILLTPEGDKGEIAAGYSSDGRLHVMYNPRAAAESYLFYIYSDDDGANWSAPQDLAAVAKSVDWPWITPFGAMIENNGVLMCCLVRYNAVDGSQTATQVGVMRLVSGTWEYRLITETLNDNEATIVSLGGNNLLAAARNEPTKEFTQYISADNGLTWTSQGALDFNTAAPNEAKQLVLKRFMDEDQAVIVAYFPKLYAVDRPVYACYAKPADLIASGTAGWALASLKEIIDLPTETVYYGDVLHYDDNYNAIGCYIKYDDTLHHTALVYFNMATTDFLTIRTNWN